MAGEQNAYDARAFDQKMQEVYVLLSMLKNGCTGWAGLVAAPGIQPLEWITWQCLGLILIDSNLLKIPVLLEMVFIDHGAGERPVLT